MLFCSHKIRISVGVWLFFFSFCSFMANTHPGNYTKRNYLCHFARVILYFQGTYGFSNPADSLFPIPTVTICMLWFIRLLENTSIYQLWASTDCSRAVQAASLASELSKGREVGKEGKEKKMATGGQWECKELVVSVASALASCWALAALFPQLAWDCAHRSLHSIPSCTFLVLSLFFHESAFVLQSSANMFRVSVLGVCCAWGPGLVQSPRRNMKGSTMGPTMSHVMGQTYYTKMPIKGKQRDAIKCLLTKLNHILKWFAFIVSDISWLLNKWVNKIISCWWWSW